MQCYGNEPEKELKLLHYESDSQGKQLLHELA